MLNRAAYIAVGGITLTLGLGLKAYWASKKKVATIDETFESHVCEHDGKGLVALYPFRLWHVTAKFKGNGPPWRRMIVYRPTGTRSLILLSPTAVPEDVMSEIDKLGKVEVLIVPNAYHRTDAAVFKKRYPDAKMACPPGWVRKSISELVQVDMDARELAVKYKDFVKVVRIGGLCDKAKSEGDFEYAYEFQLTDGTWAYAVTDTLFNCPEKGFINWALGTRGVVQSDGSMIPRVGRISKLFMHNRAECAEFYRNMANREDIGMILMAHGDIFLGQTKEAFNAIAHDIDPN